MGKFKEYLSLLRRGVENLPQIVEGISNQIKNEYGSLPEEEQQEIARRQSICLSCPLFSLNIKEDPSEFKRLFKEDFVLDPIREEYCGSCGCPIKTRTSSLSSSCGLEFYNQLNPTTPEELKWTKFNKKQ